MDRLTLRDWVCPGRTCLLDQCRSVAVAGHDLGTLACWGTRANKPLGRMKDVREWDMYVEIGGAVRGVRPSVLKRTLEGDRRGGRSSMSDI